MASAHRFNPAYNPVVSDSEQAIAQIVTQNRPFDPNRMIHIRSEEEISLIKQSNQLVSRTLAHLARHLKPGITGQQLDALAEEYIRDHGAEPAFKGYRGFPATLCVSINHCVVHGIPNDTPIQEGDIVSIDCGVQRDGYFGDAAYTFAVGVDDPAILDLLKATVHSLYLGIAQAKHGNRVGDIGWAIQNYIEREKGYSVVRDLVGHGIGTQLHEPPEIPNFGRRGRGPLLKSGMVIAIEPMINMGKARVVQASDGWSILTSDGKPSAHFEHTVAVRNGRAELLSDHSVIEEEIKNNPYLVSIS